MKTKSNSKKSKKVSPSVVLASLTAAFLYMACVYISGIYFDVNPTYVKVNVANSTSYALPKTIEYSNPNEEKLNYCVTTVEPFTFMVEAPVVEAPEEPIIIPEVVETPVVIANVIPPEIVNNPDVESITSRYGLTTEEFYTIVAIVASEGGGSYNDAYAVASTIFNRARCSRWVNSGYNQGRDGKSMFVQATLPSQYTVYQSGSYLNHMYETGTNAYNAVVTLLTTGVPMHNFLSFRSGNSGAQGTQFVTGGNIYFTELQPYEIV